MNNAPVQFGAPGQPMAPGQGYGAPGSAFGMAAQQQYGYYLPPVDRLVRKEVALGQLRDIEPPQEHIGLAQIAPWLDVQSDDVIFDYVQSYGTDGMAPARAEDAESELAMKDDFVMGQGRASIIDWALKDHYRASDVTRYREFLRLAEQAGQGNFPLTVGSMTEDFAAKLARDDARRRRRLDVRLEWLIMTGFSSGRIDYNDGRIKFAVDYGRPAGQHAQAPNSGSYASDTHNPIDDVQLVDEFMYNTQGVHIKRAYCSQKFINRAARAKLFGLKAGFVPDGSGGLTTPDPRYLIQGWGPQYAIDLLQAQTGVQFIPYDSVYRTRALGSNTTVNNRFMPENRVIFVPDEAELAQFDDTQIGFAKTLTAPHPEGNWQTGFYEWERETVDPWGTDRGTGVKAFPVFLHLDKTFTWDVQLNP